MPTVNLNKQELEKMVGKKLPIDDLKDRISMLGTDLEKIEDNEIVVEVFPNRPDMLSEAGFARALSSFIGEKTGFKKYEVKKSGRKVMIDKSVSMREFAACAIVKNLTFTDERIKEIMQLQEKLATTHGRNRKKSCYGLYPLEEIEFPIKYIAKEYSDIKFKPLGFEIEMSGREIEEKHPTGPKYKYITEDWKKCPCYVDNKGSILSMVPYTNSNDTGRIHEGTKEVFIECTGTDFENVSVALNIFVTTLADMGGEIYSLEMHYPEKIITTPDLSPKELKIDLKYINKIIGIKFTEKQIKDLLEKMGMTYDGKNKKVLVPAYRVDILHQMDIAEDIAIAYGYENFKPVIPDVMTIGQEDELEIFKNRIADLIANLGLLEINTYHLTNKEIHNTKMNESYDLIELENSKTSERVALRQSLLSNAISILGENTNKEYPQGLFEIGVAFSHNDKTETGVIENQKLVIVLASPESDFTTSKQILEAITNSLGLEFELNKSEKKSLINGRQAGVLIHKKEIGYIGEVHPQVLENFKIQMPTCALELDIGKIYELVIKK